MRVGYYRWYCTFSSSLCGFFILCAGVAFGAGASFLRPERGGATGGSGRWRRGEGEGCGSGTSGSDRSGAVVAP